MDIEKINKCKDYKIHFNIINYILKHQTCIADIYNLSKNKAIMNMLLNNDVKFDRNNNNINFEISLNLIIPKYKNYNDNKYV